MSELSISLKLFGSFRKFGQVLNLRVPTGSTILTVKEKISKTIDGQESELVFDSVLADNDAILPDTHILNEDIKLSILPPVCGG